MGSYCWDPEKGTHPFTLLPIEIKSCIFNKLPQKRINKLRSVCRQWANDIDNLYEFSVELDEDRIFLERVLQLRIVKLSVPKAFFSNNLQMDPFDQRNPKGLTFKHPNIIRHLVIPNWEMISPKNAAELLQLCQKSVQNLEINIKLSQFYPSPPKSCYNFKNLKKLVMVVDSLDDESEHSLFYQLGNSNMPNLSSLKIKLIGDVFSAFLHIAPILFKLMTKNPKGLEELKIRLSRSDWSMNDIGRSEKRAKICGELNFSPFLTPEDPVVLKRFKAKKRCELSFEFDNESAASINLIKRLLYCQRNLETIKLGSEFPLTRRLFRSMMTNSSNTITEVQIYCLGAIRRRHLDLSVFKNCRKLEALELRRLSWDVHHRQLSKLINFSDLPTTIRQLIVQRVRLRTSEMVEFFNSDALLDLEMLHLDECGDSGDFGVDSVVFEKLCRLRKNEKGLRMMVTGINCSGPEEELKFHRVYEQFYRPWISLGRETVLYYFSISTYERVS